jgi:ADP-ribose pyrophosphatase
MQLWKTRSRRLILDAGKFLRVEQHEVELPNGHVIPDWTWVVTPDFVNVAAITEAGDFVCFRQTKYAVDGITLAPVGGYIEPGEDPLLAAQRELREEAGYDAREWVSLGTYAVDGNRGAGTAYLYLALDAYPSAKHTSDDLEEQELILLNRDQVRQAVLDGSFKVVSWMALMAAALVFKEAG